MLGRYSLFLRWYWSQLFIHSTSLNWPPSLSFSTPVQAYIRKQDVLMLMGTETNSFPCKEVGECEGWCVQHCSEPPHAHSSACLSGFLLKIVFQKCHPAILGQRICTFTYPPEIPGQIVLYTQCRTVDCDFPFLCLSLSPPLPHR